MFKNLSLKLFITYLKYEVVSYLKINLYFPKTEKIMKEKKRYIYFKLQLFKLLRSDTVKTVVCFIQF